MHLTLLVHLEHVLCRLRSEQLEMVKSHDELVAHFKLRTAVLADSGEIGVELVLHTHERVHMTEFKTSQKTQPYQ